MSKEVLSTMDMFIPKGPVALFGSATIAAIAIWLITVLLPVGPAVQEVVASSTISQPTKQVISDLAIPSNLMFVGLIILSVLSLIVVLYSGTSLALRR